MRLRRPREIRVIRGLFVFERPRVCRALQKSIARADKERVGRYLAFRFIGIVIIETCLLVFCVLDAFFIRFHQSPFASPDSHGILVLKALVVAFVFQLFMHLRDIYDFDRTRSMGSHVLRLGQAIVPASALLMAVYYLVPQLMLTPGVLGTCLLLSYAYLIAWHTLLRLYFGVRSPRSNILLLGTGRLAQELVREILRRPELGFCIRGFVDGDPDLVGVSLVNPCVLGLYQDLPRVVSEYGIDRVAVEIKDRRGRLPIQELLDIKTRGIAVEDATSLYERVTGKIAIENLKPSWMIFNPGFQVSRRLLIQKRILSILVSTALLVAFSPLILLAMILIKLDSPGPVFFKQKRVGQEGRVFTLWKFRSMYRDAEATGPRWSQGKDDPRVTRIGRLLRRARLDELPQLYNIFKGDMSLVGPRPERPHFVNLLSKTIPFYELRHAVKPGITGWAQINFKYANSIEDTVEKLQYDLFYIKHMSVLLDCVITFETIKTVLVRKGS